MNASKITSDNLSSLQVLEGKKPQTLAGAAIYMVLQASKVLKQQKEIQLDDIAQAVEIKPATILEACKLTASYREHLLPDFWVSQRK